MPIYRVSYCIREEEFETEVQQLFATRLIEIGKENMFQLYDAEWLVDYSSEKGALMKEFDSITLSNKAEVFISEIFQEHIAWYMKPEREKAFIEWLSLPRTIRPVNHIKSDECTLL